MATSKPLVITASANTDLRSIAQYTQQNWGIQQKKAYLSYIHQSFEELCNNTQLGIMRDELHQGLRSYLCQKHMIFFMETENEIQIIRVLHQSMDVERHVG